MQKRLSSHFISIGMRVGIIVILLASSASLSHFSRAGSPDLAPDAILSTMADTFIASGQPDRTWATHRTFWVGHDQSGGYKTEESLIKFDAGVIPQSSRVTSAVLSLYLSAMVPGGDAPMTVSAFLVNSDWAESVTWNSRPVAIDSSAAASTVVSAQFGWYQWDLTAALQSWLDGPRSVPFSLLLRGDKVDGQHERAFWSKDCSDTECAGNRPRLEVQWEVLTPTPTATHTPTPTATPTATPLPPRLDVRFTNDPIGPVPPGGLITYTIRYENTGGEDLTSVVITGSIPANTDLVSDEEATRVDDKLRWEIARVEKNEIGTRVYKVRVKGAAAFGAIIGVPRPTATPAPPPAPSATPTGRPSHEGGLSR
jgi:uncharacterized repeat protein (TIGR01451 family)